MQDNGTNDFLTAGILIAVIIFWWLLFVPTGIEIEINPEKDNKGNNEKTTTTFADRPVLRSR